MHYRGDGIAARDTREDQKKGDGILPGLGAQPGPKGTTCSGCIVNPACFGGHGSALGDAAARGCAGNPFSHAGCHHPGTEAVRGSAGHWQGKYPKAGAVQGRSPGQSVRAPPCHVNGVRVPPAPAAMGFGVCTEYLDLLQSLYSSWGSAWSFRQESLGKPLPRTVQLPADAAHSLSALTPARYQ